MGFDVVIQKEMRLSYCQTVGLPVERYLFEDQSISSHAREIPHGIRYHLYIPDQSPYSVTISNQNTNDTIDEIKYEIIEKDLPSYEQAILFEQKNENKV